MPGERDLSERVLPHLAGWRGSAPVRVGNGAWAQRQIDVYGELLAAVGRLRDQIGELDPATRAFLVAVADTAARRWVGKDQGIWEIRGAEQDFVYSKVMCWVALDRAIALAGKLGAGDRVEGWQRTRDDIHAAVLRHGWSEKAGAFTQYFGSDDLDASGLMMPIVGFLPATDPRVLATINAIAERLTDERGLVYRYDTRGGADGLEGREGTFVLCTFWLAQALALAGQPARAGHVFERAITYLNDVGLLAEEVDQATGELLGNFPQAFSHIGLINAAWAISEAERRQAASPGGLPAPSRPSRQRGGVPGTTLPPLQPGLPGGHASYVVPVRRNFRPQAGGHLILVLLTGLTGGIAMGSVAAASGLLVVDDTAGCGEAGDDPQDAALGDAQHRDGVTQTHHRVVGDADEGLGTVEGPTPVRNSCTSIPEIYC
jgi:hypothetical protein